LVTFALFSGDAPEPDGAVAYQVLHFSQPELGEVQTGRHW
jgi:hypothetical protein